MPELHFSCLVCLNTCWHAWSCTFCVFADGVVFHRFEDMHTHTHVTNPRATRIARVEGVMEGRQVEGSLHLDFSRDLRHQGSGFDHVLDLCL